MIFNQQITTQGGGGNVQTATVSCDDPNAFWCGNGWEYDETTEEWYWSGMAENPFPAELISGQTLVVQTDAANVDIISDATGDTIAEIIMLSPTKYMTSVPYEDATITVD